MNTLAKSAALIFSLPGAKLEPINKDDDGGVALRGAKKIGDHVCMAIDCHGYIFWNG